MTVSIIIPVYNVEKYLEHCIKSVFKQTYKNIEIILVDDGSTDSSGIMCDTFARVDSRIKVVHKENGGLSSARNEGMRLAKGDYITFLDSDDYLKETFVETALNLCERYNCQMAILQMMYVSEDMNDEIQSGEKKEIIIMNPSEAIEESLLQRRFSCNAQGRLYRRDITYNVTFPDGKISEDLATCHLFINNTKRVIFSSEVAYYYRQRMNSIMHVIDLGRFDALNWTHEIEAFCKKKYPNLIDAALCRSFNVSLHLLLDLPDYGDFHDSYVKVLIYEIKRTRRSVIRNRRARIKEKIAAIISYGGERVLKIAWRSRFSIRRKVI